MAKAMKTLFLVLGFHIIVQYAEGKGLKWDQLRVTFGKFSIYPLTSEEATQNGWKWDGHCSDRGSNFFYGKRFVRGNDSATGLIFDCAGRLAGMQATISKPPENADIYNEPPWITTDDGHVALTAYFRNPKKICVCKGKKCNKPVHNKRPVGNLLWIQMSDFRLNKKVMKLPLKEKKIVDTPWVEGTCVPAMGNSFEINIKFFFVVLKKNNFNFFFFFFFFFFLWGGGGGRGIFYRSFFFSRSMKPETTPECLKNYTTVSVQHVYFVDPMKIACS
ncbi:unnamed protein product [Porites evermanni]|uniref:Uncharacterized protein n=1 Tax=Porites evermanni TaxID=104178 RepID=A0ABN8SDN5_9CNID|nr:unnamed protein product [Porites evermanni]